MSRRKNSQRVLERINMSCLVSQSVNLQNRCCRELVGVPLPTPQLVKREHRPKRLRPVRRSTSPQALRVCSGRLHRVRQSCGVRRRPVPSTCAPVAGSSFPGLVGEVLSAPPRPAWPRRSRSRVWHRRQRRKWRTSPMGLVCGVGYVQCARIGQLRSRVASREFGRVRRRGRHIRGWLRRPRFSPGRGSSPGLP